MTQLVGSGTVDLRKLKALEIAAQSRITFEEYFRAHPEAAQSISGLARDAVRAMPPVPQTVTLLQASVLCRRSKKTLERLKSDGDFPLEVNPLRRSGQPCFYRWAELRAFLIKKLGIQLPEQFPTLSDEVA